MVRKHKAQRAAKGRPVLVDFDGRDEKELSKFTAANGLTRAGAVRLLTLRALRGAEGQAKGAA